MAFAGLGASLRIVEESGGVHLHLQACKLSLGTGDFGLYRGQLLLTALFLPLALFFLLASLLALFPGRFGERQR